MPDDIIKYLHDQEKEILEDLKIKFSLSEKEQVTLVQADKLELLFQCYEMRKRGVRAADGIFYRVCQWWEGAFPTARLNTGTRANDLFQMLGHNYERIQG